MLAILNVLDRMRVALNRAVGAAIESQRENFATGWPELNIPVLDPFDLPYYLIESDELAGFSV